MALNLNVTYPNNSDTDSAYIVGKARNESGDGVKDYWPLEATWINELLGFFSALLYNAGLTPDNVAENKYNSQYVDAIQSYSVSLARLADGNVSGLIGTVTFAPGDTGAGSVSIWGAPTGGGGITQIASSTKTNANRVSLTNGGLGFSDNGGTTHYMTSYLHPISVSDITVSSTSVAYLYQIFVNAMSIPDMVFGYVYGTELIMKSSSSLLTIPLMGKWADSSGMQLVAGCGSVYSLSSIVPSSYTDFYLRFWVNPNAIS